ncbi:MAG: bifunctional pyr operon transcriptional regulator/uracil phosphoribosyltransferase PyrR [Acidobacteria bacterium]|nr:bifunctional pyr operon transcriptional regulator/uracil phosphoribosyltransferase PyrR [Acidobacteriota bacterium]
MERQIMSARQMDLALARIAAEIVEKHPDLDELLLIGIRRRGIPLSVRLQRHIEQLTRKAVPLGILDITLYRDDLTMIASQPVVESTQIEISVQGRQVILVDDVLYTGRTVRAALDLLVDFGRPSKVELAVLIDRGNRELPIQADYVGKTVQTAREEVVEVQLAETDKVERVVLTSRESMRSQQRKKKLSTPN